MLEHECSHAACSPTASKSAPAQMAGLSLANVHSYKHEYALKHEYFDLAMKQF